LSFRHKPHQAPLLRPRDEVGSQGVALDVPKHIEQRLILLNWETFESPRLASIALSLAVTGNLNVISVLQREDWSAVVFLIVTLQKLDFADLLEDRKSFRFRQE
jgi:hypothetical protein